MKQFALFMYAFAAICLIAGIILCIAHVPVLGIYTLLAAPAFAIPAYLVQRDNPEEFKKS